MRLNGLVTDALLLDFLHEFENDFDLATYDNILGSIVDNVEKYPNPLKLKLSGNENPVTGAWESTYFIQRQKWINSYVVSEVAETKEIVEIYKSYAKNFPSNINQLRGFWTL